jgi:histidyl-tRNA synthetase
MTARGTKNYGPEEQERMSFLCNLLKKEACRAGAEEISTPILLGEKYRFDLTIPFANFIRNTNYKKFKRFEIGKVFRYESANVARGRFCEFIQADFDIVGVYPSMLPEAQILDYAARVMEKLGVKFTIKVNFKQNLDKMIDLAEIDSKEAKFVCTQIDKLDKQPWEFVCQELLKNLSETQVANLKKLLDENHMEEESKELLEKLGSYCDALNPGMMENVKFDASLARGLHYYTGILYEIVVEGYPFSVAGGGRYDGMLDRPAVGIGFGVNRLELCGKFQTERILRTFIVSSQENLPIKLKMAGGLPFRADYFGDDKKIVRQINYAIKNNYDFIFIIEDDLRLTIKENSHSEDVILETIDVERAIEIVMSKIKTG